MSSVNHDNELCKPREILENYLVCALVHEKFGLAEI